MTKMALTNSLSKTSPRHRKRRVTGRQRRTPEKWCEFHKSPWHNTDECRSKQSLVVEIKDKELNPDSEYDSENNGKGQIIDADPTSIVATTQFNQKNQQILKRGAPFSFTDVGEGDPTAFYC
jgi:hypothetical protein